MDCITSSYGIAVVQSITPVMGTIIHTSTCLFVSMCACFKSKKPVSETPEPVTMSEVKRRAEECNEPGPVY